MIKSYTEIVTPDLAFKLKELGYNRPSSYRYREGKSGEMAWTQIIPEDNWNTYKNEKVASAPKYAEVLEWLMEKKIAIEFHPWFTMALDNNIGYVYSIYMVDEENASLRIISNGSDFASLPLCLEDAVTRAIELINEKEKQ